MSEAVSALNGALSKGAVTVQDIGPAGMITVRGDLTDGQLGTAIREVVGTEVPGQRKINRQGARSVAWMSPDELLILLPYGDVNAALETLTTLMAGTHFLVANVSDARALFKISGKPGPVRETIAKLAPVDMSADAFAPGDIRRSRLAQVAGAFWLTEEGLAQVVCFRSVARYTFDILCNAASAGPVGYLR